MIKKSSVIIFSLLLLSILLVSCSTTTPPPSTFADWVKYIGSMGFLDVVAANGGNTLVGFVRILVAILVFAILYEAAHLFLSQNIAITISAILAIISAIFIPGPVLAGIGSAYATLFSLALIAAPVVGGLWAIWRIPGTTRAQIGLRIVILFILLWVLIAVKEHAQKIIT